MEISFYLKRLEATTETSIFARIIYNGIRLKYYLPEKINPKFWNKETQRAYNKKETQKLKVDYLKEAPEFNQRLDNITSDIKNVYRKFVNDNKGVSLEPELFKELLDRVIKMKEPGEKKPTTFLSFFEYIIERSEKGLRLHHKTGKPITKATIKTYKTTYKHLEEFTSKQKKKIDFKNIDLDFYNDYTEYLTTNNNLTTNAIGKDIQIIKLIMNEATEMGLNTNLAYKSKRFVTIRENSDSIYLTENEIREIELLDLSKDARLDKVRDLFLIGCYTGLRYSDYSIIKPEQIKNGFIETKQIKTGYPVVIPIHSTVQRIIEKYNGILPRSISNQKTNDYLKELGKRVASLNTQFSTTKTKGGLQLNQTFNKWELLTSHTGRRSFATNEYLAGTPSITIMAITGHRTEKSFLRYIKLTPNEHAKLLKLNWEKRNKLKAV